MPYYSYLCNLCGFQDEAFVDVEKRDKKWPCEQEGCTGIMEREMDAPSFKLKGGGWYKDGYNKKPEKAKEKEKDKE